MECPKDWFIPLLPLNSTDLEFDLETRTLQQQNKLSALRAGSLVIIQHLQKHVKDLEMELCAYKRVGATFTHHMPLSNTETDSKTTEMDLGLLHTYLSMNKILNGVFCSEFLCLFLG